MSKNGTASPANTQLRVKKPSKFTSHYFCCISTGIIHSSQLNIEHFHWFSFFSQHRPAQQVVSRDTQH